MSESVPEGWELKPLGELAKEVKTRYDGESEIPVLSVTKYDGFVDSLSYFKKQVFSRELSNYKMVSKGEFAYATIHLDEGSLGLLTHQAKGLISPMYTVFKTNQEVDSFYLFSLLKSDLYMTKYPVIGQGSIDRRMAISFKNLSEIKIHYPPLPEQQKIASILTSVDTVIEKTEAHINKLKDLKKAMMQELLTKGIGHAEFKDSPVGRIPKGWDERKLNDLVEHFQNGYAFSSSGYKSQGIPIISIVNISLEGQHQFDEKKEKKWGKDEGLSMKKFHVKENDLIIAMTDVTPKMNMIGRGAIVNRKGLMLLNQRVGLIKTTEEINKRFLSFVFNSNSWRNYCKGMAGLGAQANLGTREILAARISYPPLPEQQKIASILTSVDTIIEKAEAQINKLKDLKKALMQDLLTGKVRVKV